MFCAAITWIMRFLNKSLKQAYRAMLRASNALAEHLFVRIVKIEVGCHYPRLALLTGSNYLAGFEANPRNISEYFSPPQLHAVYNMAIVCAPCNQQEVSFFLPRLGENMHMTTSFPTGKGSILPERHTTDDVQITVKALRANQINSFISNNSGYQISPFCHALWIDAEGLSLDILCEYIDSCEGFLPVCIHVEIEVDRLPLFRARICDSPLRSYHCLQFASSHDLVNALLVKPGRQSSIYSSCAAASSILNFFCKLTWLIIAKGASFNRKGNNL